MANKIYCLLTLTALCSTGLAGITTYSYNPYTAYQHFSAAPVTTYASPGQQFVYHPAVYQHTPVITRSYIAPAASYVTSVPTVKTGGTVDKPAVYQHTPAVYHNAPAITKTYIAPAPVVKRVPSTPVVVAAAATPVQIVKQVEFESEPQYDFSYGVHDSLTGDVKSQVESRSGGNVVGSYSVLDADGYKRTVTYTADDLNGFNAVVQREPIAHITARGAAVVAPAASVLPTTIRQLVAAQNYVPIQQQQQQQKHQQQQQQQSQQQHIHYLPQLQQEQQQAPTAVQTAEQHIEQPAIEPVPIEYPEQQTEKEQQQEQQHQQEEQQPEQPQYPQDQHFPPYQQQHAEGDDSDVVDIRLGNNKKNNAEKSKANAPTPLTEV